MFNNHFVAGVMVTAHSESIALPGQNGSIQTMVQVADLSPCPGKGRPAPSEPATHGKSK